MRSNPNKETIRRFRALVRDHYRRAGRHTLPWRKTRDPYAIVVSEVMLQQTQVTRVLVFYPRFIRKFPSFRALARAPLREILKQWQGLGYNRRAVSLKRLAEAVVREYRGALPRDPRLLERLPGIGRATAGSIAAFAFNIPVPFIETNIRRVFIHHFFRGRTKVSEDAIMALVIRALDGNDPRAWYSALMDYGTWLAKRTENPNRRHARYRRQPKFAGSSRELRGKIVRHLLAHPHASARTLARTLDEPLAHVTRTLAALRKDGLVN